MKLTKPKVVWLAKLLTQTGTGEVMAREYVYETWEELEREWESYQLRWWEMLFVGVEERNGSTRGACIAIGDPGHPGV